MALFLMDRYLGEDEEDSQQARDARSRALLSKLQLQVRGREKQSSEIPPEEPEEHLLENEPEPKKQEWKETEEVQPTKKKKREKSEGVTTTTKKLKTESNEESAVKAGEHTDEKTAEAPECEPEEAELKSEFNSVAESGFHVLRGFRKKKVEKVKRVLPQWLAQPDVIQRNIKTNLIPIHEVPGISQKLLSKLQAHGIHSFFPVQAEVIPAVLESVGSGLLVGPGGYRPRDICVSAPTGSGKTLAFVIPVVQALSKRVVCEVRALAVVPTKELAQQVSKVFRIYCEGTSLKVVSITGQKSLAAEEASLFKSRGGVNVSLADIVVSTPGRLVDHIHKNNTFRLRHLRFLIIDEADRMIDSMHQFWLAEVIKAVYGSPAGTRTCLFSRTAPGPVTVASLSQPQMPLQKLLFSATLTQNPEKLQLLDLHQPRLFSSTHSSTVSQEAFHFPQGLSEYYVPCSLNKKPLIILHFLLRLKFSPVLCFTNSREAAHRLYLLVKLFGGVEVAEFSSNLSSGERKKTLKNFQQGKIAMLISTDAAARGIDITGVKCVINYDAPQFIRTYIHRVGRTARAGKAGLAFTFLLGVQVKKFLKMVWDAGSPGIQKHTVQPNSLSDMESSYERTLTELEDVIREEKQKKR